MGEPTNTTLAPAPAPPAPHPTQTQTQNPTQPAELFPGHHAQLDRRAATDAAFAQAAAVPLPGPLLDAFLPPDPVSVPTIDGQTLTIRRLVHFDFVLLQRLDSPLITQLRASAEAAAKRLPQPKTDYTDEQSYEMVYQFTRPVLEAAKTLARGREAFRQTALEQIGIRVGPVEMGLLIQGCIQEVIRSFSTVIKYTTPAPDGSIVFPPPPPAQTTASGGGSITSAAS
jgi:hypothetical protein